MPTDNITLTQLSMAIGILVGVVGLMWKAGGALTNYIIAKVSGKPSAEQARQTQSEQCRFDHTNVTSILLAQNANAALQNANIAKLIEQHGVTLELMKKADATAELRHAAVMNEFRFMQLKKTHAEEIERVRAGVDGR